MDVEIDKSDEVLELMLEEYNDSKKYYRYAMMEYEQSNVYKDLYKQLALDALKDVERLNKVFVEHCDKSDTENRWYKHFTTEVITLRNNINKL